jgi:hypothetical protein
MKVVRTAVSVLAAFGLTVGLSGQAGVSPATLPTSEKQHVKGRIQIESLAARQTRIQFWLNTPTYLARQVVLESDSFAIRQEASGGVLIESAGPVRVTGFGGGIIEVRRPNQAHAERDDTEAEDGGTSWRTISPTERPDSEDTREQGRGEQG